MVRANLLMRSICITPKQAKPAKRARDPLHSHHSKTFVRKKPKPTWYKNHRLNQPRVTKLQDKAKFVGLTLRGKRNAISSTIGAAIAMISSRRCHSAERIAAVFALLTPIDAASGATIKTETNLTRM